MSEKEEGRAPTHRRYSPSNRGPSGQNRLYNELGVKDLRELLDRKRSERGHISEGYKPPPDPSFNYLKDPLRENDENNPHEHSTRPRKYHNKNNNYKRDHPQVNKDIQSPLNIKIEFSTSTGEHVYKMDKTTILPTIKHVPDLVIPQNRPFIGRGRGRGRGQQRTYHTRTIRSNVGRHGPKNKEVPQGPVEPPSVVNSEENWDEVANETKDEEVYEESEEQHIEPSLEDEVNNLKIEDESCVQEVKEEEKKE